MEFWYCKYIFLGSLESLELTKNELTTFPSNALRPIHKLVTLHIDGNEIKHISENAFQGFGEKMKYLWMQDNLWVKDSNHYYKTSSLN